jgi:glutamyl-tRNA reductase
MLNVGVLGINFKTADLQLREEVARAAQSLKFFHHPIVLLSTCNRTEIYFSADDLAAAHSDLLACLRKPFEQHFYSYFGIDCFAHLCRVTAGLDSAIFAETEIQRQVKLAYSQVKELPACLHYAFQKALKVGKMVRSRLDASGPTLYGTLWQLAEWKNKRVLLVGYSEINRGFASFLMHKGIERFSLCTQSPSAVRLQGVRVYDRSVLSRWQEYDLIVCATKSDEYLVAGQGLPHHTIFDLSVPRNVDPEVGHSATLYNMDQLAQKNSRLPVEGWESFIWGEVVKLIRIYRDKSFSHRADRLKCL